MSANTTNQQITYPVGTDLADNPTAFLDMLADVEGRLVQRYTTDADRLARNPAPTTNELSIVGANTWYDRWTGAKWLPATPIQAVKTANQIISNSTAFANDLQLVVPIPTINSTYAIEATIAYLSTAVADIKFQFTVPAGSGFNFGGYGAAVGGALTGDANFAWATNVIYGGSGSDMIAMLQGTLIAGGTAGSLQLQWAQNTLEVSNTTVFMRSWLRLTAIA